MNLQKLRELFLGFFRAGILGYGGGPSSIPLVQQEAVVTYKWMNDEEFSDVLALGNTLPGPIITKMAGYIGYHVSGIPGLLVAIGASVIPTVFLMVILVSLLSTFREVSWINGMTEAVAPVVGVMLFTLAYSFYRQSTKSLGWKSAVIISVVSIITFVIFDLHPAIIIGTLIAYALIKK
ncbi:chromate transporter [Salipaludibacillus daqingensis]|uniref:chromate transporter n=1 Tax=Salipaludibacillus daqingensis TaxID=3041001 RepID=UPI00247376DF|nr:chromate transporter [Salipaludibacillus daqingensis]